MKISIVIPVYNSEKYLDRCLNSLKNQINFNELQVIIINDGSNDNSKNIISKFRRENKNVVVKNISHSGVSKARNVGIKLAVCPYIAFLDADDYTESDYYTSMLNQISDSDLIVSGYTVQYENSNVKYKRFIKSKKVLYNNEIVDSFLTTNIIGPNVWNKLFLTNIVKHMQFDERIKIAEDKWFVFQYLTKIKKLIVVPMCKYDYMINSTSSFSKSFSKDKLDSIIISDRINSTVKKQYPELSHKADSYEIDTKVRVYCELIESNYKYNNEYFELKNSINSYSIIKKIKYSNIKHSLAFILVKISPKLYLFFQKKLKMQYRI